MSTSRDLSLQLTHKGLVAAICADAAPYTVPACWCGEHVSRDGLCRQHAEERP